MSLTRILRSARLRCAARGSAEAEGRLKPMITQRFLYRLFFFVVFVFPFKPDSVLQQNEEVDGHVERAAGVPGAGGEAGEELRGVHRHLQEV